MSFNRIVLGHPEAHEKLTARLYWKRVGDRGYIDAGNVRDYSDATTRSTVNRSRTARGMRHVNDEQADVNHEAYLFTLDERFPEQEQLVRLATIQADQQQRAVEGASATLEAVSVGRWFDVGAYNLANVAVTGALSGPLEEGTDYELDYENGRLRPLVGGDVAEGETLYLTFDQPGLSMERAQSQQTLAFLCDVLIEEFNQYSRLALRRIRARMYLNVTEFPQQTGEFASYRVKATPADPTVVTKRPEALTLPVAPATDSPAGDSSSSSSLSSSSSSSSSSTSLSSYSSKSSPSSYSSQSSSSSSYSSKSSNSSYSSQSSSSSSSTSVASFTSSSSSSSSHSRSSASSVNSSSSTSVASYTSSSSTDMVNQSHSFTSSSSSDH